MISPALYTNLKEESVSQMLARRGLRVDQAKRLKQLERENTRLKKVVADQALNISILKEVSEGNY